MRLLCFSAAGLMLVNLAVTAYALLQTIRVFTALGSMGGAASSAMLSTFFMAIINLVLALLLTIILLKLPSWIESRGKQS